MPSQREEVFFLIHQTGRSVATGKFTLFALSSDGAISKKVLLQMTAYNSNSNSELQPCSGTCANLRSFAYKVPWGSQSLRIFYVKELFLSYNICCIFWNTICPILQFEMKLSFFSPLPLSILPRPQKTLVIFTQESLPNRSGSIVSWKPELPCSQFSCSLKWLQLETSGSIVSDATGPKAEIQGSNLSILNKNKPKAALIDIGYK